MSHRVVQVDWLTVCQGRRDLLQVANLAIESGELVAIVGPNGAGKSTLLRALVGMQPGARGRIDTLGESVLRVSASARTRLRQRLGYVPQAPAMSGELPLTVREVAAIGRSAARGLCRRLRPEDWLAVDRWLAELGVEHLARQPYSALSGGEQRRVLLARALAGEASLLLLDEPAANLDLGARERLVQLIDRLHREQRVAVLLVCHELEVIPSSCRRLLLMHRGRIVADGHPERVLTAARLSELYGAPLRVLHEGGRHLVAPGQGGTP